jgi:hypothetical protein
MLNLAEIGPALYGAWRLALFDPGGMRYFDRSLNGFWRSFRVAILAAPLTALLIWFHLSGMRVDAGWLRIVTAETIAYVVGWVAFPLAAFYAAPIIDREDHYLGLVVAYNWASLIQLAVLLPAYALASSQLVSPGLSDAVSRTAEIAILVYEWFVFRTALQIPGLGAAGVVLADVIISLVINSLADTMVHAS